MNRRAVGLHTAVMRDSVVLLFTLLKQNGFKLKRKTVNEIIVQRWSLPAQSQAGE